MSYKVFFPLFHADYNQGWLTFLIFLRY